MMAVVVVTVLLRTFVVESCPVLGPSMEPTLLEGERVLVWKLYPGDLHFDRGDLLVFARKEERGRRYIKRLIAQGSAERPVPIVVEKGRVFVDNQAVDEPYLLPEERESPVDYQDTLQPGHFFLLGDHRSVSKDSLRFGPVREADIIGRAFFRIWPLSRMGWL